MSLANFRICRRKSLSDRKNRFSIPQNCFLDENYLKIRPKSPKKCQTQVINNAHRDFVYASKEKPRKLRYICRLFVKELILANFLNADSAQLLERMIELSLYTEESLR